MVMGLPEGNKAEEVMIVVVEPRTALETLETTELKAMLLEETALVSPTVEVVALKASATDEPETAVPTLEVVGALGKLERLRVNGAPVLSGTVGPAVTPEELPPSDAE